MAPGSRKTQKRQWTGRGRAREGQQSSLGRKMNNLITPSFQVGRLRARSHIAHGQGWYSERASLRLQDPHHTLPFCLCFEVLVFFWSRPKNRCECGVGWGVESVPPCQLLIWGGKMNPTVVNTTSLIDSGKCLAAPIHLPKGNVIRAWGTLQLSLLPSLISPSPAFEK